MAKFQNHQWAATDYGLESTKPGAPYEYNIEASRLLEMKGAGRGELYDWPYHMAEKTWVDIEAFIEAFTKALELHEGRYEGSVDSAILGASIDAARSRSKQIHG